MNFHLLVVVRSSLYVCLLNVCLLTSSSFAVVTVDSGTVRTASSDSTSDFGFANVGARGSASGVYLGDRWVLTAQHVGAGSIIFGDMTYYYETGTAQKVKNPTGVDELGSDYTDLILYRITEEPDLPSLKIAAVPPSVGTELYLAGNGMQRETEMTYWNVDATSWTWTESATSTKYWGYKTLSTGELNWGKNQVIAGNRGPTDSTHYLSLGSTDIVAIKTRFDSQEPYEAQAVSGDSGGGAFYWDDQEESWVLAGVISCIEVLPNSPTQAIAGATTCCVDLSFYREEILAITAPEVIPGDANGDEVVDGADVTILAGYWHQTTELGAAAADFNGDGLIDGSDVTILAGNWQYGVISSTSSSSSIFTLVAEDRPSASEEVPEPSTWMLLIFSIVTMAAGKMCSLRKGSNPVNI